MQVPASDSPAFAGNTSSPLRRWWLPSPGCAGWPPPHGTAAGRRYEVGLSVAVWTIWLGYQAYDFFTLGWDPGNTLPLQICDFVAVIAALAFVRPTRRLQSLAYFWGIALSTQAFITPDLAGGPEPLLLGLLLITCLSLRRVYVWPLSDAVRNGATTVRCVECLAYSAAIFAIEQSSTNDGYLDGACLAPDIARVLGRGRCQSVW